VGKSEVSLRRHVAQHGSPEPADHGGADPARNVIVSRGDIRHKRSQGIERRLVADLKLSLHVLLDEVHRNMTRAFDHYLAIVLPRSPGQLTQCIQLRELSPIIAIAAP